MKPEYPKLSEHQIQTQWFVMPAVSLALAFDRDVYMTFLQKRKDAEAKGHTLELVGWPNGTTIYWERPEPNKPMDVKGLIEHYHAFHSAIDLYYEEAASC